MVRQTGTCNTEKEGREEERKTDKDGLE